MSIKRRTRGYLTRIGIWLITKLAPPEQRELLVAQARLQALQPKMFEPLDYRRARRILFDTDYDYIFLLCSDLNSATQAMLRGEKAVITKPPTQPLQVSVEDFFMDEHSRFAWADYAVTVFQKEGLDFLKAYHSLEKVDHGISAYNRRILKRLESAVCQTVQVLEMYCYEI